MKNYIISQGEGDSGFDVSDELINVLKHYIAEKIEPALKDLPTQIARSIFYDGGYKENQKFKATVAKAVTAAIENSRLFVDNDFTKVKEENDALKSKMSSIANDVYGLQQCLQAISMSGEGHQLSAVTHLMDRLCELLVDDYQR